MKSREIRKRFLEFFARRGHAILPSASLVPEHDPSVLFTTAGMQPLVPYLMGESHPQGRRLANVQKCVRTQDIDEVGDNTHDTFFEMLGNWSLGDYFKKEAIEWSYEFLTSKTEGLGLDPSRLYITVFGGNKDVPEKDDEAFAAWKSVGIAENRIYFMEGETNWWSPGPSGPCGPDTEMFYDLTPEGLGDLTKEEFMKADSGQKVVEVWNDVFMEYEKRDGRVIGKLSQKNVDTGAGLERVAMVTQGVNNIFDTDLFAPIIAEIKNAVQNSKEEITSIRIVADHIRTAVFMIADGVVMSNTDRGYILRRLLRRAVRHADKLGIEKMSLSEIADTVIKNYGDVYPELSKKQETIKEEISNEENKFRETLARGLKELEKLVRVGGFEKISEGEKIPTFNRADSKKVFNIFQTYGFPLELIEEELSKKNLVVDRDEFKKEFEKHQELSRVGAEKKFKGGLADTDEMSVRYHTATHLLHAALREVLGEHIKQKGSNITSERLRFDFSHPQKMTDSEIQKVEDIVNQKIKESLPVSYEEVSVEEARAGGAIGVFGHKYGEKVRVYRMGDYSKEICGGPHVKNTSELGSFKITKEEASSAGVRRIKAILS